MPPEHYQTIGLILLSVAALIAAALLLILAGVRRHRHRLAPDWPRMLADTHYFRQSMHRIFRARGYEVVRWWEFSDPIERQTRELRKTSSWGTGEVAQAEVQLKFSANSIEAIVRYPVPLKRVAEVEERMSRALLEAVRK